MRGLWQSHPLKTPQVLRGTSALYATTTGSDRLGNFSQPTLTLILTACTMPVQHWEIFTDRESKPKQP